MGNFLIGAVLVGFWILGCGITTRWVGVPLEGEEIVEVEEWKLKSGRVDAIVLLGGGMGVHQKCGRAEMFGGADRVWHAARLWRRLRRELKCEVEVEQWNLKIFCSGGGVEQSTVPLLMDLGVPRESIELISEARNTEEEAKLIAERLVEVQSSSGGLVEVQSSSGTVENKISNSAKPKILLVTSAWHMPRAKMLFERAGFEIVEGPCDYEMHYAAERSIEFGDFFPSAEALVRNSAAIKEWVARIGYAVLRR